MRKASRPLPPQRRRARLQRALLWPRRSLTVASPSVQLIPPPSLLLLLPLHLLLLLLPLYLLLLLLPQCPLSQPLLRLPQLLLQPHLRLLAQLSRLQPLLLLQHRLWLRLLIVQPFLQRPPLLLLLLLP